MTLLPRVVYSPLTPFPTPPPTGGQFLEDIPLGDIDPDQDLDFEEPDTFPLFMKIVDRVNDRSSLSRRDIAKISDKLIDLQPNDLIERVLINSSFSERQANEDVIKQYLEGILVLLSSGYDDLIATTLFLLNRMASFSDPPIGLKLLSFRTMELVLETIKPNSMPFSVLIHNKILSVITSFVSIVSSNRLSILSSSDPNAITFARNQIFNCCLKPSSAFISFYFQHSTFSATDTTCLPLLTFLGTIMTISPFHAETLEFVLSQQIPLVLVRCLTESEKNSRIHQLLVDAHQTIDTALTDSVECGNNRKKLFRELTVEGMTDDVERRLQTFHDKYYSSLVEKSCLCMLGMAGSNSGSVS
ncbi:hypothetical protein BLNAU_10275 [Blattamonas nauphoetae]|uniref:Uncharacterized protein n=1 Tax=Blattamonas nauphoetae TaxID=2049346 RepID=A0ABQ9XTJ5_9EUKA|nr:hypothetical protein BLNAU_10275 [Blattamonas nauphoetae]